jgi:hypothetical protein
MQTFQPEVHDIGHILQTALKQPPDIFIGG